MSNDTKVLGALAIGLLSLMVVMGLVFIVGDQYLKTICENIDGGSFTTSSACVSTTNASIGLESNAFNQTELVISAIELITAFLTIIVLVLIVKILVQNAKSVGQGE